MDDSIDQQHIISLYISFSTRYDTVTTGPRSPNRSHIEVGHNGLMNVFTTSDFADKRAIYRNKQRLFE